MWVPDVAPGVVVGIVDAADLRDDFATVHAALSEPQRERWARLRRQQDRDDFLAARVLAAELVRSVSSGVADVSFTQLCETCGGPHGRPQALSGSGEPLAVEVSWAHADGGVAAAVAAGDRHRLGIDLEHVDPRSLVPGLTCTGRSFVRGEAAVKAGVIALDDVVDGGFDWPVGATGRIGAASIWDIPTGRDNLTAALAVTQVT